MHGVTKAKGKTNAYLPLPQPVLNFRALDANYGFDGVETLSVGLTFASFRSRNKGQIRFIGNLTGDYTLIEYSTIMGFNVLSNARIVTRDHHLVHRAIAIDDL